MRCYRKNEFMKRADFLHVHSGAIIFCLTENPTLPLRHKNWGSTAVLFVLALFHLC